MSSVNLIKLTDLYVLVNDTENLNKQIFDTLSCLTDAPYISNEKIKEIITSIKDNPNHDIFVLVTFLNTNVNDYLMNINKNMKKMLNTDYRIIGMGTIIIEQKLIHSGKQVAHIEDVVITKNYQNQKYGTILLNKLMDICETYDIYKIILDCSEKNVPFYNRFNFEHRNCGMAYYL